MAKTPNLDLDYNFQNSLLHSEFVGQVSGNMEKVDTYCKGLRDDVDENAEDIADLNTSVNQLSGVVETFNVSVWTADANIAPYTYKATVTIVSTLTVNTIVELLNDNATLFATYGFAIGSISGQVVTIYSIGQPQSAVSLSIRIGGVLSNSGGGGGSATLNEFTFTLTSSATQADFQLFNKIVRNAKGRITFSSSRYTGAPAIFSYIIDDTNNPVEFEIVQIGSYVRWIHCTIYQNGNVYNTTGKQIDSSNVITNMTVTASLFAGTLRYYNDTEITQ